MRLQLATAALAALGLAAMAGCAASPEGEKSASAGSSKAECTVSTGSNICRRGSSGGTSPGQSVSGEDLRRSGGQIGGPAQSGRVPVSN